MIIVDTNLISDAIAPRPTPVVRDWLASQPVDELWTTAITAAELRAGAAALPAGQRRSLLVELIERLLIEDFEGRVLPFDDAATVPFAQITARQRRLGRPVGLLDVQIAAIAVVHGAAVATRNTLHFEEAGLVLINPWND